MKYCFSHQLSGNRNMFSLYPNYLRKWMGGEGPRGVIQISSDGDDRRIFWGLDILDSGIFLGRKNWRAFFLGTWFKKGFFGYSKQSEDSDGMMNKQTQTFNFYCSYFLSYIIYSLLQMLRLRNLAWDVFGVNFWSGFFGGVLIFVPIRSSLSLEIQSIPSPGGRGSLFTRGVVWYFMCTCMAYEVGTFLGEAGY